MLSLVIHQIALAFHLDFVQITRVNDLKEYLCNVYDDIILITKYINVGLYKCYFCDMPGSQIHKCL